MPNTFGQIWRAFDKLTMPVVAYRSLPLWAQAQTLIYNVRHRIHWRKSIVLLANMGMQWTVAVMLTPLCALARLMRLRFFMVDLTQIGSVMWLDLFLRECKLKSKPPRAVFVCRSRFTDANGYFLDLYCDHVTFIANPFLRILLFPFFVNPWLRDDGFRYEPPFSHGKSVGELGSYGHGIVTNYSNRFSAPLVRLPDADIARGRALMAPLIEPDKPFVALHVRDSGFYRDLHRTTRSADIRTYEPAIQYLIERGYSVVRTGDPAMVRIDDMIERCGPQLIDYAHSELKSQFLDVYLIAACRVYVGSTSGPLALPIALNVPSCYMNFYTAAACLAYYPGDLTTFKKVRRIDDDSLVPFERLLEPQFSENPQHEQLRLGGYYLEDNSPEEILAGVREYFERINTQPTARQRHAKSLLPKSGHIYEAAGDFSDTILRLYFPDIEEGDLSSRRGGTQAQDSTESRIVHAQP